MRYVCVCIFVLFALTFKSSFGILFDLGRGQEECFFEDSHQGAQISGAYTILDEGKHYIDFKIFPPSSSLDNLRSPIYSDDHVRDGRFEFIAKETGTFMYCFKDVVHSNKKMIAFTFNNGQEKPVLDQVAKHSQLDILGSTVMSVAHQASQVKFRLAENGYRSEFGVNVLKSANSRVRLWSRMQIGLVFALAALQVMFLQKMFQSKTKSSIIRV